jgi:tetratricopeptide (TPR) repeat protein
VNGPLITDQIAQVDRDLAEIDEQVQLGELDDDTANRLRSVYRSERSSLEDQLASIEASGSAADDDDKVDAGGTPARQGRSKGRSIAGTAIVGSAVIAVAVVAVFSLQERTPAGEMSDGVATDAATEVLEGQTAVDLDSVTSEQMEVVVSQNPDVPGMRIALANRYLEEGNLESALRHYEIALEQQPDEPSTVAWVGWLTFLLGDPEGAEPYVVRAIEIEPEYPQAYWFLANIRYESGDLDGTIVPIEKLLTYELPEEVREEAVAMLAEARG